MSEERSLLDLSNEFREAIETVSDAMKMNLVRQPPSKVILSDFPVEGNYRSGVRFYGRSMYISRRLPPARRESAIRREAFILLIPPKLDSIPQIYDLAWAYSGADRSWWDECTQRVSSPLLPFYDAPWIFAQVPEGSINKVLRSVLGVLRVQIESGYLVDFESYFNTLLGATGLLDPVRLSKSQLTVLRALTRDPYSTHKKLVKKTGLAPSTVSKAVSKLTRTRLLSGPESVNLEKLGLAAVLITFRGEDEGILKGLAANPFTYRIYRPLGSHGMHYCILLFPNEGLPDLRRTLSGRAAVSRITAQTFNVNPSFITTVEAMTNMSEVYTRTKRFALKAKREFKVPRLTRQDLILIDHVMRTGRISVSEARRLGVRSAELRLRRLRGEEILLKLYLVAGARLGEPLAVLIEAREEELPKVAKALQSVSSAVVTYIEGDFNGVWALLYAHPRSAFSTARAVRLFFSSKVKEVTPLIESMSPVWRLPIELWDEESNKFNYELALRSLAEALAQHPVNR